MVEAQLHQHAERIEELLVQLLPDQPRVHILPVDDQQDIHIPDFAARVAAIRVPEHFPPSALKGRLQDDLQTFTLKQLEKHEKALVKSLGGPGGELAELRKTSGKLERSLFNKMREYKTLFPEDALDVDIDPASIPEFRQKYKRLREDDLPRHEHRFRDLLRQGTIRGILSFKSKLEEFEQDITAKIELINQHLRDIDYDASHSTYICIVQEPVRSEDILTFKHDLKACLSEVYGETEDIYTEEKFYQVKKLLDRFRGDSEEDQRWTRRVTDVRQWFTFGAGERYRENDESREYFSDSSGKSASNSKSGGLKCWPLG